MLPDGLITADGGPNYASAILNILEDAADEHVRLKESQRAVLNILDDSTDERRRLDATQRAVLNILEDSNEEKLRAAGTQRAVLNILDDFADERTRRDATQKAVLNILDDSHAEQLRLADTQRAVINILDDFEIEKSNVERINIELRNEVAERARAEESLQRANAAADEANQELEAFSYSVAHDLRAPLRSVDGFSLALLEDYGDSLDDTAKTYCGHVREAAQHMARLIDDLLSLSRVTRAELNRSRIDLAAVARDVIAQLQRDEPDRAVDLIAPTSLLAHGDVKLVKVALTNLLGNAWKFTGKTADARIELGEILESGHPVYFIRDNGAGFDMAYADKLFEVFQRLHTVAEFEGTGIGLATVQRVIRRHGGRIWAEGAVGRGATFYFTIKEGA